jgi:hypothetical protein
MARMEHAGHGGYLKLSLLGRGYPSSGGAIPPKEGRSLLRRNDPSPGGAIGLRRLAIWRRIGYLKLAVELNPIR